jgi:hypothetical protein
MEHAPQQPPDPSTSKQVLADTVGFVPNTRKKDNVVQGISVAITGVIGAIAGWFVDGSRDGALLGLAAGLLVGGVISGLVLMVVGWVRTARAASGK